MTVFTYIGIAAVILYGAAAVGMATHAYGYLNPNRVSPRPTRRKGKHIYFWPYRPFAAIVEGIIWPFSMVRLVRAEIR